MKKTATTDLQSVKIEIVKIEMQSHQMPFQKSYRKIIDHSHGRVNKSPFGINHEPGTF
ncbi:MAG: hypothetical protein JWR67_2852 [Mucilaginibacter sp.]|jgi:hypothetical protein|nr:hypothetical protein [Mucilaginibacter sp.]MDB5111738.1 hypothetical protein [Mucilaginibacter sp.]